MIQRNTPTRYVFPGERMEEGSKQGATERVLSAASGCLDLCLVLRTAVSLKSNVGVRALRDSFPSNPVRFGFAAFFFLLRPCPSANNTRFTNNSLFKSARYFKTCMNEYIIYIYTYHLKTPLFETIPN